ncbi:SIS domain-containing protein [Schleiferilactobacillus perolens]|uniref:SIS domain-containing protein n=1 Tax=Schleiferilactobacillus perolens DSM 12744 TaxID=1423792 RepID=A0A0R1NAB1_9LACO|nr:SIS domain-containing protein [Schleiferilactobacillus perolens]KRL14506.1 hypothetical protein FD09_GL000154 [Schleiferilactobacillus perolens DSM 12744]
MKPTMYTYINQEHTALKRILNHYPQQIDATLDKAPLSTTHWLILGTGSSINAAKSAKLYIEKIAKVHVQIEEPFNYAMYETIDSNTDLVIGVSQSGQSTATLTAIQRVQASQNIYSIAVTSQPNTELPRASDATLDILTGKEWVGYVTMGYNATVLSLMLLGLRYARRANIITPQQEKSELGSFQKTIERVPSTIDLSEKFYHDHQSALHHPTQYTAIGYGATNGTVSEMATKFTEVVREPSAGFDLEAFMHGPYLGIHPTDCQFYIETAANQTIKQKMHALRLYEQRYIKNIFTVSLTNEWPADEETLFLGHLDDPFKAPLLAVIPFQVWAWLITTNNGVNLSELIFTDFSEAVHNKTENQQYV